MTNGTNSAFSFDGNRRVTSVYHTGPGDALLLSVEYGYDGAGNPLYKNTSNGDYQYQYDALNQLVYQETPYGITSWTYDDAFRRVQELSPAGLTLFNYNAAGQLLTTTGAKISSYTYDDNGNTVAVENALGSTQYSWDDLDRLSGATLPSGAVVSMTYRFDNLLSSKTGLLGTQQLLWDGGNIGTATGAAAVAAAGAGAVFLGADTTTQGSWRGVYGADGYNILQEAVSYPSYATVSESGATNYVWQNPASDGRALLYPAPSTSRIAACWYSATSFTVDVDLTDGLPHQVGFYCVDWEGVGRTQTITVKDAISGAVLDTQTLNTTFQPGHYLRWTITGHVQFVFTNTNMSYNAVVSGLFFDTVPPSVALFTGTDTATQGNWQGVYGSDGYNIIEDAASYPAYAAVSETGISNNTWSTSTSDVRALQAAPPGAYRIAACWYSATSFTVDINLTDGKAHQVSLYVLDWSSLGWTQTISIQDATTGLVLSSVNAANYQGGVYYHWTITGHVKIQMINTGGSLNSVLSGLFFDSAPAIAAFLGTDSTTQGNWKTVYGADGYNIIQDAVSYPSYAAVSETGTSNNTWTSSTTDVRALEQVVTGRIAADWYSATNFTVDINLTDGKAHKVSIYCLDWDETTRSQTIAVQDARTGAVLNTQTVGSFNNGIYLSWTITGHVKLVFTNTNATYNAVVSGLFFDSFASPPAGGYGIVAGGVGLTRTIGVDANGNPLVRQYHTDGQGSVLAITDGQGNLVTGYQIDAWGNVLAGGTPGNTFDFLGGLGYWADPDLGLHYVRARWLNPQTGSWLSVDPNLDEFAYQYANNMPTTSTDPSGKDVYEHLTDGQLQWTADSRLVPEAMRHGAAEELRKRHPSAPNQTPTGNSRRAASGQGAPGAANQPKQPSGSPPPTPSAAKPAGAMPGNGATTLPPDPRRMAGSSPGAPTQRGITGVSGSALTPDRLARANAIEADTHPWVAGFKGAGYGLGLSVVAGTDALSAGLLSRFNIVPEWMQHEAGYQESYGFWGLAGNVGLVVLSGGASVVGESAESANAAAQGSRQTITALGRSVAVSQRVVNTARVAQIGTAVAGTGQGVYNIHQGSRDPSDYLNVGVNLLSLGHAGFSGLKGGGLSAFYDTYFGLEGSAQHAKAALSVSQKMAQAGGRFKPPVISTRVINSAGRKPPGLVYVKNADGKIVPIRNAPGASLRVPGNTTMAEASRISALTGREASIVDVGRGQFNPKSEIERMLIIGEYDKLKPLPGAFWRYDAQGHVHPNILDFPYAGEQDYIAQIARRLRNQHGDPLRDALIAGPEGGYFKDAYSMWGLTRTRTFVSEPGLTRGSRYNVIETGRVHINGVESVRFDLTRNGAIVAERYVESPRHTP